MKEFHRISNLFPLMEGAEFEELKQDIAANGLREAIWLHPDGSILDGRNRYRACLEVGVEPQFRTWDGEGGLVAFVLSMNLHRRHLNETQRGVIAYKIENMSHGRPRKDANLHLISRSEIVMEMNRVWAMPNAETFTIPPIREFVKKYLRDSEVSIDPFARNCGWATYTNDLNSDTTAQYHLDSTEFLALMETEGICPDLVIFDPPYSPERMKRSYDSIGLTMKGTSALRTSGWKSERDIIARIQPVGGVVLSFGWNSNGMGRGRNYEILEILLVCHGAAHNDTICVAERKMAHQSTLI